MHYNGTLSGKYVTLRSIEESDAAIVHKMRTNPEKTKYMGPPVKNDITHEIEWIRSIREKEGDYTFVALDKNGKIIGKLGMYDIDGYSAQSGRLLMYGNSLQSIESLLLIHDFVFNELGLSRVWSTVEPANTSSLKITRLLGAVFDPLEHVEESGRIVLISNLTKENYFKSRPSIEHMIYRKSR